MCGAGAMVENWPTGERSGESLAVRYAQGVHDMEQGIRAGRQRVVLKILQWALSSMISSDMVIVHSSEPYRRTGSQKALLYSQNVVNGCRHPRHEPCREPTALRL